MRRSAALAAVLALAALGAGSSAAAAPQLSFRAPFVPVGFTTCPEAMILQAKAPELCPPGSEAGPAGE
jgi:hypothetical protein